jgi:hypothetical protein
MRIEIPGRGKGIPRGASAKRLGSTQTSFLSPTPLDAIPRKKNPEPRIPTNRSHPAQVSPRRKRAGPKELRIEFLRKSIHLLIAAVPTLSTIDRGLAIALLFMGTLGYAIFETLRRRGIPIPLVSRITMLAARRRDSGKFVAGPVTLGLGALLSVILFQEPAASVAVYTPLATAFPAWWASGSAGSRCPLREANPWKDQSHVLRRPWRQPGRPRDHSAHRCGSPLSLPPSKPYRQRIGITFSFRLLSAW